jgi:hypothetical protein
VLLNMVCRWWVVVAGFHLEASVTVHDPAAVCVGADAWWMDGSCACCIISLLIAYFIWAVITIFSTYDSTTTACGGM